MLVCLSGIKANMSKHMLSDTPTDFFVRILLIYAVHYPKDDLARHVGQHRGHDFRPILYEYKACESLFDDLCRALS